MLLKNILHRRVGYLNLNLRLLKMFSIVVMLFICISFFVLPVNNIYGSKNNGKAPRLNFVSHIDANVYTERLVYELFHSLGYDISINIMQNDKALQGVNDGIYDGISCQAASDLSESDQLEIIPFKIANEKYYSIVRESDETQYSSWDDLSGKSVGILSGKNIIKDYLPKDIKECTEEPSNSILYDSLLKGEYDVLIVADSSDKAAQDFVLPSKMKLSGYLGSNPCYIYLNKKYSALVDDALKRINEMDKNGSLKQFKDMKPNGDRIEKCVFYLSSYSSEKRWEQNILDGINYVLDEHSNITYHNIALNSYRNTDITFLEDQALTTISSDFIHTPPDAVIVSDNEAMRFLFNNFNHILPNDIPIVFCGLNGESLITPEIIKQCSNMGGVFEDISASDTVSEILRLFPSTESIFVINDYSLTGTRWQEEIKSQLEEYTDEVDITYNKNITFDELRDQVSKLKKNSVVLNGSYFLDSRNNYYPQETVQRELSNVSSVPLFGLLDSTQGKGQLGGKYADSVLHGETAAEMIVSALDKDENKDSLELVHVKDENRWIFDKKEMQKYGIAKTDLPAGSEVLNSNPSLYESNPTLFYVVITGTILSIIIIALLSVFSYILNNRNKRLTAADEANQKSKNAIARAYNDLQQVIKSTPLPIVLVHPSEKEFLYANSSWNTLFQIPEDMDVSDFKMGAFAAQNMEPIFRRAFSEDRILTEEVSFVTCNGEIFETQSYFKKIVYDNKECLVIVHKDLREEKAREQMLRNAAEKEIEASKLKSNFLMNMSHEIRTPMNSIIGITQLVKSDDDPEKMLNSIMQIGKSASVLLNIINDVLDMSLIEDGNMIMNPEICKLSEIIGDVSAVIDVESEKKQLKLNVNTEAITHDLIIADASRLQQVLIALLSNAVKFTQNGGEISLTASETEKNSDTLTYTFEIVDNGIGIEPDKINRLFKSFEQSDGGTTREFGGMGLGLTISKDIVTLMGGEIWAENNKGAGSTFTFTIQVPYHSSETENDADVISTVESGENAEKEMDFTKLNILVVDDVDINRMIIGGLLSDIGANYDEAENGQQALDKIISSETGHYDMILMDIQMPVMDGCSATKEIRKLDRGDTKKIPIIAVTANVLEDDIKMIMDCDMQSYLSKPVFKDQIIEIIKKYID